MQVNLSSIQDANTRQALDAIQREFNGNTLGKADLKLITITETASVTGKEFFHGLGFIPTDILVTKLVGGPVTWDWTRFTKDRIYYTTSGATELRALIGRIEA